MFSPSMTSVFLVLVTIYTCSAQNIRERNIADKSICSNSRCGKYKFKQIWKRYPEMFHTRYQIRSNNRQFSIARKKYLLQQGVEMEDWLGSDGDACCPTKILTFSNTTMNNIYGKPRAIIHTPPKYQYIPHGICVKGGTCDGKCVNEPVTHSLLTYNIEKNKLEFDLFIVPGYCSCKSS